MAWIISTPFASALFDVQKIGKHSWAVGKLTSLNSLIAHSTGSRGINVSMVHIDQGVIGRCWLKGEIWGEYNCSIFLRAQLPRPPFHYNLQRAKPQSQNSRMNCSVPSWTKHPPEMASDSLLLVAWCAKESYLGFIYRTLSAVLRTVYLLHFNSVVGTACRRPMRCPWLRFEVLDGTRHRY